jgi:hypothetical protein
VSDARNVLYDKLTATLRRDVEAHLADLYRQGRRQAFHGLRRFGERDSADALPAACPYALDEICLDDWYPANRNGAAD